MKMKYSKKRKSDEKLLIISLTSVGLEEITKWFTYFQLIFYSFFCWIFINTFLQFNNNVSAFRLLFVVVVVVFCRVFLFATNVLWRISTKIKLNKTFCFECERHVRVLLPFTETIKYVVVFLWFFFVVYIFIYVYT